MGRGFHTAKGGRLKGRGTKIALCNEHHAHVLHVSGYSRVETSTVSETRSSLAALLRLIIHRCYRHFSVPTQSCKLRCKRYSRNKMHKPRKGFCWSWFYKKEHRVKKAILRHFSQQYVEWHRSDPPDPRQQAEGHPRGRVRILGRKGRAAEWQPALSSTRQDEAKQEQLTSMRSVWSQISFRHQLALIAYSRSTIEKYKAVPPLPCNLENQQISPTQLRSSGACRHVFLWNASLTI